MGGSNDFQWKQRRASRLIQSLKGGGDGRILTANEGCSLEYYRTSGGDRVDLILTRPKSSEPPSPFGDK